MATQEWSPLEINQAREYFLYGLPIKNIAEKMGRSIGSINKALSRFGIRTNTQRRYSLPKLTSEKKTTKNKLLLTEKIQTSCIKNNSYRKKCKIPIWKRFISDRQQGSQKEGVHLSGTIRTGRANFHNGQVSACRCSRAAVRKTVYCHRTVCAYDPVVCTPHRTICRIPRSGCVSSRLVAIAN